MPFNSALVGDMLVWYMINLNGCLGSGVRVGFGKCWPLGGWGCAPSKIRELLNDKALQGRSRDIVHAIRAIANHGPYHRPGQHGVDDSDVIFETIASDGKYPPTLAL